MPNHALLLGTTGLVGRNVLALLRTTPFYDRITVFTRRPLPAELAAPTVTAREVDFDDPDSYVAYLDGVDHVICALGTTIRKAGSREAFRKVDVVYPYEIAEAAKARGATHYLLVSALGADPDARIFYNRCKGELEQQLRDRDFRSLTIARPSLLLGDRDAFRFGEEVAKRFAFLFPSKYKPVQARAVAAALVHAGVADEPGVRIMESAEIRARFQEEA